jgi:DNA-binding LytR/AlgR family response regulator
MHPKLYLFAPNPSHVETLKAKLDENRSIYPEVEIIASPNKIEWLLQQQYPGLLLFIGAPADENSKNLIRRLTFKPHPLKVAIIGAETNALEAWNLEAFHFIVNPVQGDQMFRCYQRYRTQIEPGVKNFHGFYKKVTNADTEIPVPFDEFVYAAAFGNYTYITFSDGNTHQFTMKIGQLASECLRCPDIRKLGRSFLINIARIRSIEKVHVHFDSQKTVRLKLTEGYIAKLRKEVHF